MTVTVSRTITNEDGSSIEENASAECDDLIVDSSDERTRIAEIADTLFKRLPALRKPSLE